MLAPMLLSDLMKPTIWRSLHGSKFAKWIAWSHHGAWWSFGL